MQPTVERKSTEEKLSSTGVFEPFSLSGYQLILNFHFENLVSTNIFFSFCDIVLWGDKQLFWEGNGKIKPFAVDASFCMHKPCPAADPGTAIAPDSYSGSLSEPSGLHS